MIGETSYVKVLPRWYSQADCVGMTFGDWCVPSCKDGYTTNGSTVWTCDIASYPTSDSDGTMAVRGENPMCTAKECTTGLPPVDEDEFPMYTGVWVHDPMGINGSRMYDPRNMYAHNCSGLKTDEHCTVSCGPGYEGVQMELTCLASGHADGGVPSCSPMECHRPYEPVGISTADCEHIEYLGRCRVGCAEGYALDTLRPELHYVQVDIEKEWTCGVDPDTEHDVVLTGEWPICSPKQCQWMLPRN